MVHVAEEARAHPSGRLLDRYHFRYALRLDRPCMGAALQETYPSVMQNKKTALVAVFLFLDRSLWEK